MLTDPADTRFLVYLGARGENPGASVGSDRWEALVEYVHDFVPRDPDRRASRLGGAPWVGPQGAVDLRLSRSGAKLVFERRERDRWNALRFVPVNAKLPENLSLGLAGYNELGPTATTTVRFTDLSVREVAP